MGWKVKGLDEILGVDFGFLFFYFFRVMEIEEEKKKIERMEEEEEEPLTNLLTKSMIHQEFGSDIIWRSWIDRRIGPNAGIFRLSLAQIFLGFYPTRRKNCKFY